jgi:hypothetical protein
MIHSLLQMMENRLFESSIFVQVLKLIVVLLAVVKCFLYHCALVFIQAEGMVIESDFWHDYLHGSFLSCADNRSICREMRHPVSDEASLSLSSEAETTNDVFYGGHMLNGWWNDC